MHCSHITGNSVTGRKELSAHDVLPLVAGREINMVSRNGYHNIYSRLIATVTPEILHLSVRTNCMTAFMRLRIDTWLLGRLCFYQTRNRGDSYSSERCGDPGCSLSCECGKKRKMFGTHRSHISPKTLPITVLQSPKQGVPFVVKCLLPPLGKRSFVSAS